MDCFKEKETSSICSKGWTWVWKIFSYSNENSSGYYGIPCVCARCSKVQNTILKSVYANFKGAANVLGVRHLFRFVDSKLEITYKPRGNKIYFAGADDPEKIKSIKDADFPLAIMWVEELAEFKNEDEVTTIENSVLREELEGKIENQSGRKAAYPFDYSFYYSYNPPKRRQSWVNKKYESSFIDANTFVCHSDYLGNPRLSKKNSLKKQKM